MTHTDLTLVLGGNGKTGRRVAQRLRALDRPVRIGSRAGDPPFDWTDRATWPGSLAGVRAAYLTYQPDLAFPGAAEAVGELAALAAAGGVRRLVLLSGRGEDGAQAAEKAVVLDGRNVATTGGVAEALGRPPRDFTEFAATEWRSR